MRQGLDMHDIRLLSEMLVRCNDGQLLAINDSVKDEIIERESKRELMRK